MHCRFLPFVRRALGALALAWSLCAARGVQAGNILETTGVDLNEPLDPFDDQTVLVRQRWSDQALPVRFYLYRQPDMIGGSVMNPAFYSIDLDNFIWPTDIQRQLQQTLQSWTGCSFSHFSFDPTLNYADQLKPFTDPPTLNPVDRAQLDGYNLITFQEPVVVLPTGITSETSLFILTTGFDVEGLQNRFPSAILGRTENNATIIDINQDGNADLILTRDSYNDGEIIDADIIFDSTEPNYVLWPEDIHDVTVPLDQILGTLDIQALTAHELGHAQGLAHSQLATPILFESVTEVNLLPGGAFSFNPYAKREPKYDDFVSQALQYPGGQPSNRGAFGGQVLNGDFLDLFFVGTPPRTPAEPTDPFVLQTPVYLCQQATSNESHPDNTDYLWMEQPNRHFDQGSGQTAVYDENTSGGLPITFRRVASVPTGLDLRINIGGNAGPHTPPEVLDSSYFIPGVPIRDDYALYIDDARMTNVNDVLSNIEGLNSLPANPGVSHPPSSVNYAFPPEYYGGANAPAFGSGSGTLPYSIEYTVDSQTRVSVGVPGQGNVGLPLTSGHDNPEKNFALIEVDGHRFDTRQEFPGQIITPIFTNFLGTAVGVFRIDDKAKLGFQVGFTTAGGLREEGPVLPMDDVAINYRFDNLTSDSMTVRFEYAWDLVAVGRENPFYYADGTPVAQTTTFTGAAVPSEIVFQDSPTSPLLAGVLTLRGPLSRQAPAKVVIGDMNDINEQNFNIASDGTILHEQGKIRNTGVALVFDPVTLAPDSATSFTVVIGSLQAVATPLKDSPWGNPLFSPPTGLTPPATASDAVGTVFYDNAARALRLTAIPGTLIDGIDIITNTADYIPTLPGPLPPPPPPPPGAVFTLNDDLIPQIPRVTQHGVATDIDNDGDLDIVLAVAGQINGSPLHNRLLQNLLMEDGRVRFVDVTYGPDGVPYTGDDRLPPMDTECVGVAAADFDGDGYVDLFFSNVVSLTAGFGDTNHLYHNRGDGSFEDITFLEPIPGFPVVPGILDAPPASVNGKDISGVPAAGDIDGDGDVDLIIPLFEGFTLGDNNFTAMYQDSVYGRPAPEKRKNYDGLYFQRPMTGALNYEVDEAQGTARFNCRVLVNQSRETGVTFFLDDTLGRDHAFGGFQPIGGAVNYANLDRMPPILPDFVQTMAPIPETEYAFAVRAVLANCVGDTSLDILLAESEFSNLLIANPSIQPYLRILNNLDSTDDARPDGYFQVVNFGQDYTLYPLVSGVQTDLFPFLLSVPAGFPDSDGPNPANWNAGDLLPVPKQNVHSATVADMKYQGNFSPIAACSIDDSYMYLRKYTDNRRTANNEVGCFRGQDSNVLGGDSQEYLNQMPFYDSAITVLADRYPFPYKVFDNLTDVAPPGIPPIVAPWIGDPWDVDENTPVDLLGLIPGEEPSEDSTVRYDVSLTVGAWDRTSIPTRTNYRTRDVAAEDFNRDGFTELMFANDVIGDEGSGEGAQPANNWYFTNDGTGALTNDSATALVAEPANYSTALIPADFDNDGDIDVYVCSNGSPDQLLLNYTYHQPPNLTRSDDPPMFYDGNNEYLPPYFGSEGNPPLLHPVDSAVFWNSTFASASADLNGDGRPDIVCANGGDFTLSDANMLYFNIGNPLNKGLRVLQPMNSPFPAPAVFQPQAILSFSVGTFEQTFRPTSGIALADLDLDGDYDMLDVNFNYGPRYFQNVDSDSPLLAGMFFPPSTMPDADNLGDGIFLQAPDSDMPIFENPLCGFSGVPDPKKLKNTGVALADLDGDGRLDVVISNRIAGYGAPNVVMMNTDVGGQPHFTDETETRLPTITYTVGTPPNDYQCTQGVNDDTAGVACGDFNGDGFIDIFFGNSTSPANPDLPVSRLLLNNGAGVFTDAPAGTVPTLPEGEVGCVLIGDFDLHGEPSEDVNYNGVLDPGFDVDGDGILDNGEDSINSRKASNLGAIPGLSDNGNLDFLDLNGNGIADLSLDIFIGYKDHAPVLLLNDDQGAFIDASSFLPVLAQSVMQGADAGDVDLDGDLDIALALNVQGLGNPAAQTAPNCGLLINNGAAGFFDASYEIPFPQTLRNFRTSALLHGNGKDVDLIDLDGDGDLDIFFSQAGSNFSGAAGGYLNFVMVNRILGANHNARRTSINQVPGSPVIKAVSPPGAVPGDALQVIVSGYNLAAGSTFDFGPGVSVVGTPLYIDDHKWRINLQVDPAAPVGPRVVTALTPMGLQGASRLGLFSIFAHVPGGGFGASADSSWTLYETTTADNVMSGPPVPSLVKARQKRAVQ